MLLMLMLMCHVVGVLCFWYCCWFVALLVLVHYVVSVVANCYVDDVVVGPLYYLCYCWFGTLQVVNTIPFYIFVVVLSCLVPTFITCVLVKYYPHCHAGGTLVVYHVIVCQPNTRVQLICYIVSVAIKVHCVLHVP